MAPNRPLSEVLVEVMLEAVGSHDNTSQPGGQFLRLSEAAKILGISTSTAYRWAESGRLPVVELPGPRGRFVPARALVALIDAGTELALENLEQPDARSGTKAAK